MNSKFQNIGCCKSYTLSGLNGGEVSISETVDRLSIVVTVRVNGDKRTTDELSVHLHKGQFEALCGMNSTFDGLQVENPKIDEVADEPDDEPAEARL